MTARLSERLANDVLYAMSKYQDEDTVLTWLMEQGYSKRLATTGVRWAIKYLNQLETGGESNNG